MFPRDEAALEVGAIGVGATHELLFDSGRLKPSDALEALSVRDLSRRDALKLIAQAPEAWPNLRALYLGSAGCTDGEMWRVLTESELFAQLEYLDGGGMDSHALERAWTATVDSEDSVRTFRELIGALVDEVFDGTHHPFFAYRLLVHVVAHTSTVARMGEIAKMLGMARQGREPRADLAARILVEAKTRLAPDGISPNPYVAQHPAWRSGACTREALAVAERELQNTVVGRSS
jgi:hypothetical protein